MKPLFEIPVLTHLSGLPFGPLSALCDGAGIGCSKGCTNGCNTGCGGGSTTPPVDPQLPPG
jgi:hypothetical protein